MRGRPVSLVGDDHSRDRILTFAAGVDFQMLQVEVLGIGGFLGGPQVEVAINNRTTEQVEGQVDNFFVAFRIIDHDLGSHLGRRLNVNDPVRLDRAGIEPAVGKRLLRIEFENGDLGATVFDAYQAIEQPFDVITTGLFDQQIDNPHVGDIVIRDIDTLGGTDAVEAQLHRGAFARSKRTVDVAAIRLSQARQTDQLTIG